MGIPVKLVAFEGPLDLLLHLIDKNKVNIYDIPIVMITQQYLDYVNAMDKKDLNIVSEFLVMAATLLEIKSKMLLPAEINEEGEEEDPRQELVEKLLEYKMYKYMSFELRDKQVDAAKSMYKVSTVPPEVEAYRPPVNLEELVGDLTLSKLNDIFQMVIKRKEDKIDHVRSTFGKIEKEEINMEDRLDHVKEFLMEHDNFSFTELLMDNRTKMAIIVTFLVVLELIKTGFVSVQQDGTLTDIIITVKKDPNLIGDLETPL